MATSTTHAPTDIPRHQDPWPAATLRDAAMPHGAARLVAFGRALVVGGALLYGSTALIGVLVAFDQRAAFARFLLLAVGLLAAAVLTRLNAVNEDERVAGSVAAAMPWLTAALGVFMLLGLLGSTADVTAPSIQDASTPPPASDALQDILQVVNRGAAAGALSMLLSLAAAGVAWQWPHRRVMALLTAPLLLSGLMLLTLADARGAWLGLITGAVVAAWLGWRTGAGRRSRLRYLADAAVLVGLIGLLAGVAVALFWPGIGGSEAGRVAVWRDTLPLIADYRFTGSGLTGTAEHYAAYVHLLHVNFITHARSLYLQIAVEQGVMGLIGFVSMLIGTGVCVVGAARYGTREQRLLALGAAGSLTTLAVHGLVDADLYVSLLVPLLFLPLGMGWAVGWKTGRSFVRQPARLVWAVGLLAPLLAGALLFAWSGAPAAFFANLGAVSQSRAELSVYVWPEWPLQDEVRRSEAVDLQPALTRYGQAIYLDPQNGTARARLGQIGLSFGDIEAAERHLSAAHATRPHARAAVQLLGEVYALTDRPDEAATLWQSLRLENGQLDARAWWWGHIGTPEQQAAFAEAMRRLTIDD